MIEDLLNFFELAFRVKMFYICIFFGVVFFTYHLLNLREDLEYLDKHFKEKGF